MENGNSHSFCIAWMNMVSNMTFSPSQIQRKRNNRTMENTANSDSGTFTQTNKNTVVIKFEDGQTLNLHYLQKKKCCSANTRNTTEWIKWISESFSRVSSSGCIIRMNWLTELIANYFKERHSNCIRFDCLATVHHYSLEKSLLLERIGYLEKRWPTVMLLRK